MTRRRLPIGIQNFRRLRETGSYYVDKTSFIRQLVEQGDYYFLSRPRRFGKSLLLDTMGSLFEGREPLFRGLDIHPHWDWSAPHPVLRLSFGGKYNEPGEIEGDIIEQLESVEREHDLAPARGSDTGPRRLRNLLDRLHGITGRQVVVLVDEYDKPILDVLHDPDLATANRDYLRGFYGIVKDSARHVRFVFVTGVSMFSKVSLFSGLNNLKDISLDPRFGTICGYREEDLDRVFGAELVGLDREMIRNWYNGYHWRGGERVYNPYDVLLLLDSREFRPYWFETGSPAFLFRMLMEKSVSPMELEGRLAGMSLVSKFDVGDIDIEALLFQTGYLTIAEEERDDFDALYRLDYPNLEVRLSLSEELLAWLGRALSPWNGGGRSARFWRRTISRVSARRSAPGFRGFPISGMRRATSRATRHGTRAFCTCACVRLGWTSGWRSLPPGGGRTWCCISATRFSCWSSRWPMARPAVRPRSRRCGSAAMRSDTVRTAWRFTWSGWPADGRRGTFWRSAPSPHEGITSASFRASEPAGAPCALSGVPVLPRERALSNEEGKFMDWFQSHLTDYQIVRKSSRPNIEE